MIPNPDLPNLANHDCQEPWAVIVAPTRELVIQIGSEARKFAFDSVVKADIVYGGTSTNYQSNRIKRGCHILVATPGRLLDFINKGKVHIITIEFIVIYFQVWCRCAIFLNICQALLIISNCESLL